MSDEQQIEERIAKVVVETLKVERAAVTRESRFVEDLGADSVDMFTLLTQLEDEFQATIAEEDALKLATVGAAIDYIRAKAQSAQPAQ